MKIYWQGIRMIWIAPSAIIYDREQMEWLLPYLPELREGRYPPEPIETGYVDGYSPNRKHSAPYEEVCMIASEVDSRLAKCRLDRPLLEVYYCDKKSIEQISLDFDLSEREVSRRIASALSYISSGPCRRWVICSECDKFNPCHKRKKGRTAISYRVWVNYKRPIWGRKLRG